MIPRLLLVEDDAVTAAFIAQALAPLPLRLSVAANLAQARARADGGEALWLFDARLPDGWGDDLLASLRARGWRVPALALTAEDDPAALGRLRSAGFTAVLAKPIGAAALRQAVSAAVAGPAAAWDDAAALSALGGEPEAVRALRRLFLKELPGQSSAIAAAWSARNHGALREHLHRLKASCALVGASGLLESVRALHADPGDPAAHSRLQAHVATLVADAPA